MKNFLTYILLLSLILPYSVMANAVRPGLEGYGTQWSLLDWPDTSPNIIIIKETDPTAECVDVSSTRCPADGTYQCGDPAADYYILECGAKTAMELIEPRVLLYETSGVIQVDGGILLRDNTNGDDGSYMYSAGSTAPFPGITFRGATVRAAASHLFFSHFRTRVGDAGGYNITERDAFAITPLYGYDFPVNNVVLDHVSASWAVDGNVDVKTTDSSNPTTKVTISNSIIGEALHDSKHDAVHSYQSITDSVTELSYLNTLFINSFSRNPQFNTSSARADQEAVIANSYFYNLYNPIMTGANQTGDFRLSLMANTVVAGDQSTGANSPYLFSDNTDSSAGTNDVYLGTNDTYRNDCPNYSSDPADCFRDRFLFVEVESTPITLPSPLTLVTVANRKQSIINNAGAYPAWRDAADLRMIAAMENDTGGQVPDCVDPTMANYAVLGTSDQASSSTTLGLDKDVSAGGVGTAYDDHYNNMGVTMTSGDCNTQEQTISDYVGSSYIATVPGWDGCVPSIGDTFSIDFDCSEANFVADGWSSLETAENYRELTIPDNPHDDRGDGWTNLEGFIFGYNAIVEGGVSVTLTGTAIVVGVTESQIVTGGKTIIEPILNDTWVETMCDDNAITTAHIAGFTFDQSEAGGWANQVTLDHTMCTRDSDTQITWILPATPGYDITKTETGTDNVPATSTTNSGVIVASPTFPISVELEPPAVKISVQHSTTGRNAVFSSSGYEVQ